jgi:hypothetical protein
VYELGLAAHEQYDPASAREQGWTNQQNHRNKVVFVKQNHGNKVVFVKQNHRNKVVPSNKTIGIKLYLSNKTIGIKLHLSNKTIGIKLYLSNKTIGINVVCIVVYPEPQLSGLAGIWNNFPDPEYETTLFLNLYGAYKAFYV